MKCNRALLSAYLDNELKADDRHALEVHVASCDDCTQQLERYRRLRFELRDAPIRRAPAQLGRNVEARIQERRRHSTLRWLPIAVGVPLSVVGVLAGAAFLAPRGEPSPQLAVTATSPMTGANRVAPNGPVELWFDRELMPGARGVTVTVDPALPVRVSLDGNALRIEPDRAFEPGQSYTVAVESVLDVDGRRLKNPAVVSFVTAPASLADVTGELGSPRGEPSTTAAQSDSTTRSKVTDVSIAGIASVPSVAGTNVDTAVLVPQTRKWPSSRANPVQPAVEVSPASTLIGEALGALQAPYQTMRVLEQAFQGGVMVRIGDSSQTLVLQRSRGTWESFAQPTARLSDVQADASLPPPPGALAPSGTFAAVWKGVPSVRTALGWAVYEARVSSALVQHREQGTAVTLGRMAYLLRSNGTWSVVPVSTAASETP
jgi:Bacterial Ig-like domain/Putative zinc-finger